MQPFVRTTTTSKLWRRERPRTCSDSTPKENIPEFNAGSFSGSLITYVDRILPRCAETAGPSGISVTSVESKVITKSLQGPLPPGFWIMSFFSRTCSGMMITPPYTSSVSTSSNHCTAREASASTCLSFPASSEVSVSLNTGCLAHCTCVTARRSVAFLHRATEYWTRSSTLGVPVRITVTLLLGRHEDMNIRSINIWTSVEEPE
mmetsp:Transcript_162438/g.520624  ORF Transcript_162438/g.520624 Transcript_162438/m.520624 type:complete len:205 (-) Transcript_162438:343-957(-)